MMMKRFEGSGGRRLLVDALKSQKLITGYPTLADELANVVELVEVSEGVIPPFLECAKSRG